jgi:hypothetical protein
MMDREERQPEGCGLPMLAIAAAMIAMAVSLAVVRHPAADTRVWVPGVGTSADGAVNVGRAFCDGKNSQGKGNMSRTFDKLPARKPLDGAEVSMLRVVLRDFCETHGFALEDQRTAQAARRLISLFQDGESDCARLRALLDVQPFN